MIDDEWFVVNRGVGYEAVSGNLITGDTEGGEGSQSLHSESVRFSFCLRAILSIS